MMKIKTHYKARGLKVNKNIWIVDEDIQGVSDQLIGKAEIQIGVKLPELYVDILKIQNDV